MVNGTQNPNQMINQMVQNNPQFKGLMPRVNEMLANKNPEEQQQVFMNTCKSMNVDPNQLIQQYAPYLQGQNNHQTNQGNQQMQNNQMR